MRYCQLTSNILIVLATFLISCHSSTVINNIQQNLDSAIVDLHSSLEKEIGYDVPSISVLIETPKGKYFTSAAGKNGKTITADTYFRFASNTKNFTATAILKMMQDGWLNINDKIIRNIPGSAIPYVPDNPEWSIPYKNEITIKELLQHNAGVFDVSNDEVPGCDGKSYEEYTVAKLPDHQFSSSELVNQVTLNKLTYGAPNTVYHYSNTGFTMLGEIIARVYSFHSATPKTYGDYLSDTIYGPASKVPINFNFVDKATDQQLPSPYITGMIRYPDRLVISDKINASAHVAEGNGVGTMNDLNKYIRTLMKGENVLNKDMINLMQTQKGSANEPGNEYGLGCAHHPVLGYGHNGATEGYLSLMMYDPASDVSVIVAIPFWDLTDGNSSLGKCIGAMVNAGLGARKVLGYPAGESSL